MCIEAYAAGLFDGEGCILVRHVGTPSHYTRRFYHQLNIKIQMTDREPLDILAQYFGGKVLPQKLVTPRQAYLWSLTNREAQKFLRVIHPYMVCKAEQARLALEYPAGELGVNITEEIVELREVIMEGLRELKRPRPKLATSVP